jgi:hypothetical protein
MKSTKFTATAALALFLGAGAASSAIAQDETENEAPTDHRYDLIINHSERDDDGISRYAQGYAITRNNLTLTQCFTAVKLQSQNKKEQYNGWREPDDKAFRVQGQCISRSSNGNFGFEVTCDVDNKIDNGQHCKAKRFEARPVNPAQVLK